MTRTRALRANGIDFHLIEAGSGPLVLCLHGFPDHAQSFEPLLERFAAAGYHAVAPNMRGFWPTGPAPDGCYQPWATGADAVQLVTALGAERAVLVGHDWGAAAAYAAVRTAPERFSRLVGMSVPFGPGFGAALVSNATQQRRSWYMFFFQLALAGPALALDDFALVDRLWADWSPGYALPAERREALKQMFRQPGVADQLLAYYRQAFTPSLTQPAWAAAAAALPPKIDTPTLYLHGRDDGCIGAELAAGITPHFSQAPVIQIIESAGHFLQLEQADAVADAILAFLRD